MVNKYIMVEDINKFSQEPCPSDQSRGGHTHYIHSTPAHMEHGPTSNFTYDKKWLTIIFFLWFLLHHTVKET